MQQPAVSVAPSGLKSFLASLFSPLVLRYAIPALGLIVIAVVGIVMLREGPMGSSVALRKETDQNQSVAQASPSQTSPSEAAPAPGLVDKVTREPAADKNNEVPKAGAPATKDAPRDARGVSSSDAAGAAPAAPVQEAQPVTTTASEPPPPAKAAPAEESERQAEPEKKKVEINRTDVGAAQRSYDGVKKEDDANAAPATGSGNKVSGPRRAADADRGAAVGNAPQPREREEDERVRKAEKNVSTLMAAKTRTVAGREFRKDGNVWIDVAYNSSQATTIVKRDSEQYRSLVEDEPVIHTIAETLKTEFVVVWKGRAYRVR